MGHIIAGCWLPNTWHWETKGWCWVSGISCCRLWDRWSFSKAQVFFKAGKSHNGYWTSEDVLSQACTAIKIFNHKWPTEQGLFLYDNAMIHKKRSPSALSATKMPKSTLRWEPSPGIRMHNGKLPNGTPQVLYYPNDHPMLSWVLQRDGTDPMWMWPSPNQSNPEGSMWHFSQSVCLGRPCAAADKYSIIKRTSNNKNHCFKNSMRTLVICACTTQNSIVSWILLSSIGEKPNFDIRRHCSPTMKSKCCRICMSAWTQYQ